MKKTTFLIHKLGFKLEELFHEYCSHIITICHLFFRHKKRGDLVKRENDLKTHNTYDEEHFSNPAAYDNKVYDLTREGSFRKVSKIDT